MPSRPLIAPFEATTLDGLERAFQRQHFSDIHIQAGASWGEALKDGVNHRFLVLRRLRKEGPFYKAVRFQAKTL